VVVVGGAGVVVIVGIVIPGTRINRDRSILHNIVLIWLVVVLLRLLLPIDSMLLIDDEECRLLVVLTVAVGVGVSAECRE
jgi:hypothetical protein